VKIALLTTDDREHDRKYGETIPYFGNAPAALLKGLAQLTDLEVHVVSCTAKPMSSPEKLAGNTWFHSLHVPKIGWLRTGYQGCIRATRKLLRHLQPNIVHGQGTERDCALEAVFSGFPNVLTIHGNMRLIAKVNRARPFTYNWFAARLESFTIPRSAGVICITRYTQAAVSDIARRTWVLPNAVDPSFFDIEASPRPDEPPQLLCVGGISPRKNQNALIRALDPLAAKRTFKLKFLGAIMPVHPYKEEFLELLKARPWCVHDGFANREKLKTQFRQASLLILPSREDNCPLTVLEAMAAGVPVVAAKVGGVPDLIEEGQTGWFCDPLAGESMASAVEKVLADRAAAAELAVAAKKRARERFHPTVVAQRHVEIYREVLKSQPEAKTSRSSAD
jgi:glycosyltransferase involved in cell wall biosynthesis